VPRPGQLGGKALLLAALVAAACAPRNDAANGVLVVEESQQASSFIRNFNPLLEVGDVRWPTLHAMYEPLLIYNPLGGKYVPWLAEHHEWADGGHVLRFQVRAGVRWSDGTPFGAADVVFTFELLRKFPALDTRAIWQYLDAVTSPDPTTVEFKLKRVYSPALFYVSQLPIVPAHLWKDVADPVTFTNESPVATGPFTEVISFEPQAYQVGPNPYYWQGKPAIKAVRCMALPANDQSIISLLRNDLDWAGSFVPAVERIYVGEDPEHHHYWSPPIDGTVLLYPNNTRKPLDDVRVRKAISMAIDRDLMVKVAMYGYTRPADATALSDAYNNYRYQPAVDAGTWVLHDVAGAERLLDEAGLRRGAGGLRRMPDGAPLHFDIGVPVGWSDWIRATQVIVRSLRGIGVDARVQAIDFDAWFDSLQQGTYDMALGWTEVNPSPYGLYRHLMSTETLHPVGEAAAENWHRFGLPAADKLLAQVELATSFEQEKPLIDQLQMLFVENAPAIPLFPGPLWGEYSSRDFVGFPDADNPYAPLSPHWHPQSLLVLTKVKPR